MWKLSPDINFASFQQNHGKIVNQRILHYLETTNILFWNQFGFGCGRGTSDAVLMFTNHILGSFDKSECVLDIYLLIFVKH